MIIKNVFIQGRSSGESLLAAARWNYTILATIIIGTVSAIISFIMATIAVLPVPWRDRVNTWANIATSSALLIVAVVENVNKYAEYKQRRLYTNAYNRNDEKIRRRMKCMQLQILDAANDRRELSIPGFDQSPSLPTTQYV